MLPRNLKQADPRVQLIYYSGVRSNARTGASPASPAPAPAAPTPDCVGREYAAGYTEVKLWRKLEGAVYDRRWVHRSRPASRGGFLPRTVMPARSRRSEIRALKSLKTRFPPKKAQIFFACGASFVHFPTAVST